MAIARKRLRVQHGVEEPAPAIVEDEATGATKSRVSRFALSRRAVAASALLVAGVVIVMLGWYGAAHTNIFTEQIPYLISGGLLGAALIIVAGIVATGDSLLRETRQLRHDLDRTLRELSKAGLAERRSGPPSRVLVVPGGRTFHLPGCPIPEGKKVTTLPLDEALESRFTACKLCAE